MRRALAALSALAPEIARVDRVEELLGLLAREAAELLGAGRCGVFLREEHGDLFRCCAGCSEGEALGEEARRLLAGVPADGVTREVLATGRPVVVANARQDPRMVKGTVRAWRIRSLLEVPMTYDGEVIGLLAIDDPDRRREFDAEEVELAAAFADLAAAAVLQTRARLELRAKLEASCRQVQALRRASAVDERLSDLVLAERPLEELTASLAELLGKPCAVFRPDGERVAPALPAGAEEAAVPRLLEPALAGHPELRRALAENQAGRAFVVGPIPGAGVLHRHVVAPVAIGEELWGRLVVMEHKTRFTGGDVVAVRRAATLIALQVSGERRALEADWNAGSSLVAELLSGTTDAAVARRAERLGVSLEARRAVVMIGPRSGREREVPDFRAVAAAFRREAPELSVHAAAVPAGVAVLVEVPDAEESEAFVAARRAEFEAVLPALDPAGGLVAGVSAARRGRDGYRAAHREARQVVECVRRFSPPGGPALFGAEELGVGSLLLAGSDPDAVEDFAEEAVGRLVRDPSKADLLTTLCAFFDHIGSVRETAAAFDVHENTIRYRLARVEELTGLAVTHDPDAQLRARLALLVLRLQGRLWGLRQATAAQAERREHRVPAC